MKVAWICHFSNAEIQSIIHPGISTNEFAPWIPRLAELFGKDSRVELHVVTPHDHISGYKHFVLRNVHYHLFNPHIVLFGKKITGIKELDYKTNFIYVKSRVRRIMNRIKPDLVHLHGAENAYYSSSIFQFKKKYPVMITVQGFISHAINENDYSIRKRIAVEKKILKYFRHFGYRTKTMGEDIKKYNPEAKLYWHHYPFPEIKHHDVEKKYDIVFFARICQDKGIEDLLKALALVKRAKPNVRLCIIGRADPIYIDLIKKMAEQLNISENIYWAGFLPTQEAVHNLATAAKISVLPTYHDIVSGTIIESMFLKLPVIAYNVGSIHEVNEQNSICIQLVKKGNIEELSEKILSLLNSDQEIQRIAENGYRRAKKLFSNESIFIDVFNAYLTIEKDFENLKALLV